MPALRTLLSTAALLGAATLAPAWAAGSKPNLTVSPRVVSPTQKLTVQATHLKPRAPYVLLYEPAKNRKLRGLLAAVVADTHGAYKKSVKLPAVGYCGPATIYLLSTKSVVTKSTITVTCPKTGTQAPPPPPHR